MTALREAIDGGIVGERLWIYSNYHCNLQCSYCLIDSSPVAERRSLTAARMIAMAEEAARLGFLSLGVTGGEPFMLPHMPETLAWMAGYLPVLVLTNGTLFTDKLMTRVAALADLPVTIQMSLDHPDAAANDAQRSAGSHAKVVAAIARLRQAGIRVRLATTGHPGGERDRLCRLHSELGVDDRDHVIRPIVRRGRAHQHDAAIHAGESNLPPELTITADGAFWSPFGPSVTGGRLDTDLLVCRTTSPLRHPVDHFLRQVAARPPGADAVLGIR
ncbi:MAG TPA: radical SAM protein [Kofleriaceae bacterium]|nr:radical SAM protein [Kofleriaceae bacterium]